MTAATTHGAPWWFADALPADFVDPADAMPATSWDGERHTSLPPIVTAELLAQLVEATDADDAGVEFLAPFPTLAGLIAGVDPDAPIDLWPTARVAS